MYPSSLELLDELDSTSLLPLDPRRSLLLDESDWFAPLDPSELLDELDSSELLLDELELKLLLLELEMTLLELELEPPPVPPSPCGG